MQASSLFNGLYHGKIHPGSWVPSTPYTTVIQRKVKQSEFFLGTKDDQVLYVYKNISRENYYHCTLGKKTKSKCPMSMYYSCYICHKFIFFCPGYHGNYLEPKHFCTSTILDHLLFPRRIHFFNIQITTNFGVYGVLCQKFASLYRALNMLMLVGMWEGIYQHILSFIPYSKVYDVFIYQQKMIGLKYMQQC
jgi:hypothetical protein